jgi:hypothetical protein
MFPLHFVHRGKPAHPFSSNGVYFYFILGPLNNQKQRLLLTPDSPGQRSSNLVNLPTRDVFNSYR